MKKWWIATLCIIAFNQASGQRAYSLDECMRYAVEHNLQLKNYALDVSISRTDHTASIGGVLPTVMAGSSIGKRFGRSVDPNTNLYTVNNFTENTLNLNVSMPLFEGFTKMNKIAFQRLTLSIDQLSVDCQKSTIAFEVMDAFYKVVFEERLEALAGEQRKLSEHYLQQTQIFVELGLKAEADLQEVKARLQSDIYQEIFRKNNKQGALLTLKQLLNLTGKDTLEIRHDSLSHITPSPLELRSESVYELARQNLPHFKRMELQQKAARKSRAIAIGELSPTLKGEFEIYSGYYGTEVNENGERKAYHSQIKDNVRKYVGMTLSIPIFNNLQGITGVRKERWKLEQVENETERQRQQLYAEIETACMDLQAAVKEWQQAIEQVKAEEAALKQSERKWEEGLLSIFELMEIRNRYIAAKAESTRTRLQYEIKQRTVNYFKGEGLYN